VNNKTITAPHPLLYTSVAVEPSSADGMHRSILIIPALLLLAGAVSAWLPKEHDLAAFKDINKIRGVNLGGMSR
jgi:hypothetical protein